jgi:hypothetical protein
MCCRGIIKTYKKYIWSYAIWVNVI